MNIMTKNIINFGKNQTFNNKEETSFNRLHTFYSDNHANFGKHAEHAIKLFFLFVFKKTKFNVCFKFISIP